MVITHDQCFNLHEPVHISMMIRAVRVRSSGQRAVNLWIDFFSGQLKYRTNKEQTQAEAFDVGDVVASIAC